MDRPIPDGCLTLEILETAYDHVLMRNILHPATYTLPYSDGWVFQYTDTGFKYWQIGVNPRVHHFVPWGKVIKIMNRTNTEEYIQAMREREAFGPKRDSKVPVQQPPLPYMGFAGSDGWDSDADRG